MARLVREAQLLPTVRERALAIAGAVPYSEVDLKARLICQWVGRALTRIDEGVELLHRPEYLLVELAAGRPIYGDCDDAAVLVSALLLSIGIPSRFVAMRRPGGHFQHVFSEAAIRGQGWLVLDPFYDRIPEGEWVRMFQEV